MNQPAVTAVEANSNHHQLRAHVPTIVMAVAWMLIICTFNMPDRVDGATVLDPVALLKLGSRVASIAILTMMLWWNWDSVRGRLVIQSMLPIGIFAAWGLLSVLWSPLTGVSLGQVGSFIVLLLLAANIALAWRSDACTSRVFMHLSLALFVFNCFLLLSTILFAHLGSVVRTQNSFIHATMAGSNASMGFLVLLGARVIWGWRWSRVMLLPGLAVHGSLLIIAHSRTAIAATLVATLLIYILFVNRHIMWACLLFVCTAAGLYLVGDPSFEMADSLVSSGEGFVERDEYASVSSLSGRDEMWDEIWRSFLQSPWIGHGYFVSSETGELLVWFEVGNWTAHNILLQALVTTGIIGTLLLAWGYWRPARTMLTTMSLNRQHAALVLYCLSLCSWYFIWGVMNESILGPLQPEGVVFYSMFGLGIGSSANQIARLYSTPAVTQPVHSYADQPRFPGGLEHA